MVKRNIKWLLVVLVLGLCPSILHAEDPYGEMKALADSAQKVLGQDRLPSINARWIKLARELFLLTSKPVMYVCNVDEASAVKGNKYVDMVRESVKDENAEILVVAAKTEADIAELETYEDRQMFLEEVGLEESGVSRLIKSAYSLLNLQTYFTAGVQEVRAWTYEKGWKAPQCAGVIHTDFENGFIRAEVIKYEDFLQYGSEAAVKEAGKLGVEGKEYIVQDGDIMHFRFNV